tara:strand:+ start:523 stop:735 length:213 start_codon:yes stop_codon:yes gene_type:complete
MKPNFPKQPYIGQIFYSPKYSKIFRFDEIEVKDGTRTEFIDDWIDITKTFLTLNYKKIRGEEKSQQKGEH